MYVTCTSKLQVMNIYISTELLLLIKVSSNPFVLVLCRSTNESSVPLNNSLACCTFLVKKNKNVVGWVVNN